MLTLLWFRRDLRLADHPALTRAAERGKVLPVYIIDPEDWAHKATSARQWDFIAECLTELREEMALAGQPLLIRVGPTLQVLTRLRALFRFDRLVSHATVTADGGQATDPRIAHWARECGVTWEELPDARGNGPGLPIPALPFVTEETGAVPTSKALKLPEAPCPHRQKGGRSQGLALLESFLGKRVLHYTTAQAAGADRASSRLSPYLAQGVLSRREVAQALADRRKAPGDTPDLAAGLRRFGLHLNMVLPPPDAPPPTDHGLWDRSVLEAWKSAQTGLPFLDASLRQLQACGWLPAPQRALLASFACHQLGFGWQLSGQLLARECTDYHPALHWRHCRKLAGAGGAPVRLLDPVKQGLTLDPDGVYLRRWLPELAAVPAGFLHEPWKWPKARARIDGRYPEPVVDPAEAARAARSHLRRLGPAAASGPAPQRPRRASAQMALDL